MSNVDLKLIADTAQIEAISEKLRPTNDGMWRSICRAYSVKYSTPLHEVLNMDAEFIFLHHYESELENIEIEDNFESLQRMIRMIEDPDYVQEEEEELNDFIAMAEEQEEKRLKDGKPIHPGIAKALRDNDVNLPTPKFEAPKQGFVDFSKLNKLEEE